MSLRNENAEGLEQILAEAQKPVLVDFWAEWCGPCRALGPILEEFAGEYGEKIDVVKVNIDENQSLAVKYRITSIPTLIVFKNAEPQKVLHGAMPKEALAAELADYLA